jgi:hypothetical protein
MKNRAMGLTGLLTVALWIVGLVIADGTTSNLPDNSTDPAILAWVKANDTSITLGSFLFMIGCALFIVWGGMLRARLAEAEGGLHTLATTAFGAVTVMAACGFLTQANIASAINSDSVSAATAGTLYHLGDAFFIGAELTLAVLLCSVAVLAFRTAVLPRWWAILSALVGVVALVGPIGWAALIFAFPVWLLVTPWLGSGRRNVAKAVPQVV